MYRLSVKEHLKAAETPHIQPLVDLRHGIAQVCKSAGEILRQNWLDYIIADIQPHSVKRVLREARHHNDIYQRTVLLHFLRYRKSVLYRHLYVEESHVELTLPE